MLTKKERAVAIQPKVSMFPIFFENQKAYPLCGCSTTRLRLPIKGFGGVGLKYLLSPRPSVRVGCGRLGPCEKSNMFDISHDYNRFIFPAVNKISSPRRPQASSDPILHSCVLSQAACDP